MERIERVLLVVPPGTVFVQPDGTKQCKECIPPLGLGYLAAQLSMLGDYEIRVYDMVVEDFYQEIFVSPNTVRYGSNYDSCQGKYNKNAQSLNL